LFQRCSPPVFPYSLAKRLDAGNRLPQNRRPELAAILHGVFLRFYRHSPATSSQPKLTKTSKVPMNQEILAKVAEYAINAGDLKLKAEDVTAEHTLRGDLDLDSVGSLTAIMDLEEHYGIVVEDKDLPRLQTVGDVVALIEAGLAGKPPAAS
jgi:acyl carrier protein